MARRRKGSESHDTGLSMRERPVQRNAANARERARMRVLSKAFSRLKTTLPWVPPDTKLSKLDTLRLAASYIAHLRQILSENADDGQRENDVQPDRRLFGGPINTHPINLTWPFTFNSTRFQQDDDNLSQSLDHCLLSSDIMEFSNDLQALQ